MRKVIGVVPLWDEKKDSCWMLPGYMQGLQACGALPLVLPLTTDEGVLADALRLCDGLLLTGGHDIDPALYGQAPLPQCGVLCPARDKMEVYLLRAALAADKPVLGICRGIQLLNAVLGGTLYQDLPTQHPSDVTHVMTPPYDRAVHTVEILPGTLLADLFGAGTLAVNSYHHQAVDKAAPGLQVMAQAPDGLVEAVRLPGKAFVAAVQWHPEFSYKSDACSKALLQAFVDACGA